jgi:hypothetical protein
MSKSRQTSAAATPAKRGRKPKPEGRKRFWWIGTHCTEAEKLDTQALAAREKPGKPFAVWMRGRVGLPENPAK